MPGFDHFPLYNPETAKLVELNGRQILQDLLDKRIEYKQLQNQKEQIMLLKGKFRVDFTAREKLKDKPVKMSEELILNYRTEETNIHEFSTCSRDAFKQLSDIFGSNVVIVLKHIYFLTEYEEIK